MGLAAELSPKRRLKDINVFEVSFVDKAANGQKFLVFKRSERGGDCMEQPVIDEIKSKNDCDSTSRLAELSGMLDNEKHEREIISKQGEEKIKEDDEAFEDERYIELRKEVDELREMIDELKEGLPVRKGLQETEEPRARKSPKDRTISLIKSRELKAKMTHAHAPSPTQWAKELLQDGN